jgi:N-methylhydantoinase B
VIRIRTTGGGGWGDPLERPYDGVRRDVAWRKVSVEGARTDYGVVVDDTGPEPVVDAASSDRLRGELRRARTERWAGTAEPFFDRGPGYARLSGGASHADVDVR